MDLKTAEYLKEMKPLPIEIICYHSQQSAEKNILKDILFSAEKHHQRCMT